MSETSNTASQTQETAQTTSPQGQAAPEKQGDGGTSTTAAEAKLLKEVMSLKKQLKTLESEQAKKETQEAQEQGKYKELHEKATAQAKALQDRLIQAELRAHLVGLIKPSLVKLIDTSGITVDADGTISGVEEIAQQFRTENPEFFADAQAKAQVPETPKPGSPKGNSGPMTFEDVMRLAPDVRNSWIAKNETEFKRLCETSKAKFTRA